MDLKIDKFHQSPHLLENTPTYTNIHQQRLWNLVTSCDRWIKPRSLAVSDCWDKGSQKALCAADISAACMHSKIIKHDQPIFVQMTSRILWFGLVCFFRRVESKDVSRLERDAREWSRRHSSFFLFNVFDAWNIPKLRNNFVVNVARLPVCQLARLDLGEPLLGEPLLILLI